MIPAPFRVVLDANALYPFTLRDTLLRAAAEGLYQAYWSEEILTEALRNLVANAQVTEQQAGRLRDAMERAFPEAMVTGHESLITAMKNAEADRHVAAAAVRAGAQVIVTFNERDFVGMPDGIEAQTPDEFLLNLFDLEPTSMLEILRTQSADLKRPPRTYEEVLLALEKVVPRFVAGVRVYSAST